MTVVTMYSKTPCQWCDKSRELLRKNGYSIQEKKLDIDFKKEELASILPQTRAVTVPQIWFNDTYIGGYDDLVRYLNLREQTETGPTLLID